MRGKHAKNTLLVLSFERERKDQRGLLLLSSRSTSSFINVDLTFLIC